MNKNYFIQFYSLFSILSIILFILPITLGKSIFFSVLLFHLLYILFTYKYQLRDWKLLYFFLAPLSFFLVFPNFGFFYWISVSDYMAGMWIIPLFFIYHSGNYISLKYNKFSAPIFSGILAMILFSISEELCSLIPIWYAIKVKMISHIATYVIIPEGILGFSTHWIYEKVKGDIPSSIFGAFLTTMIYTGSLMFFFYFTEIYF